MIKLLLPEDIETVVKLYSEANPSCTLTEIKGWTLRGLDMFPNYNFVYFENGHIIGAISGILKESNLAIINDIVISKEYRHQNIGTTLLSHLLTKFTEDKVEKVGLWVGWEKAAAVPFYYKQGFTLQKIGIIDDMDALYLEKMIQQ